VFFIQNTWNECMLWDHVHLSLLVYVSQIFMKSHIWETAVEVSVNYILIQMSLLLYIDL
jgi:hypothetical protein